MKTPATALSGLPDGLRDPLIASYQEVITNYSESKWEPAELNGGKFCEIVYTIIKGCLDGSYPSTPSKPRDMVGACRALEVILPNPAQVGNRSLRILIPRMLLPLYDIRNNRGVGHTGGDVDPNFLDATSVCAMAGWILAELVRIFHGVSTQEAQSIVDSLVERKHQLIWNIDDVKRVLDPKMDKSEQSLLLLYTEPGWVEEKQLIKWVEYSNLTTFRSRILEPLHKLRLIEYDTQKRLIHISPHNHPPISPTASTGYEYCWDCFEMRFV